MEKEKITKSFFDNLDSLNKSESIDDYLKRTAPSEKEIKELLKSIDDMLKEIGYDE